MREVGDLYLAGFYWGGWQASLQCSGCLLMGMALKSTESLGMSC